ncbi:MAG: hypothetical protein KC496_05070 [Anaerolineae bacterium]|nr:hypothetical protein [Anaerolineae bacterium]
MASDTPSTSELLRLGIQAAKEGNRQAAQMMLQQVVTKDRENIRAMLWLAKIAPDLETRTSWLQRVLQIDPNNETAIKALTKQETRDVSKRNRLIFRLGVAAYLIILPILALLAIVTMT